MTTEAVFTVKKLIAMTPDMAAAISEFRFANRLPSEAEAIRRLIQIGLAADTAQLKSTPARE